MHFLPISSLSMGANLCSLHKSSFCSHRGREDWEKEGRKCKDTFITFTLPFLSSLHHSLLFSLWGEEKKGRKGKVRGETDVRKEVQRLSRSLSRFETQDIKTQPHFNHYMPDVCFQVSLGSGQLIRQLTT